MLTDPKNDPSLRMMAARELGILGKSGVLTEQQRKALAEVIVPDSYLKAVVDETQKK